MISPAHWSKGIDKCVTSEPDVAIIAAKYLHLVI